MLTRDQMEEQLKQSAKATIFEQQFAQAFERILKEKREGSNKLYAEKKDWQKYQSLPSYSEQQAFTVEGDDNKLRVAKWNSLLKDSAFYLDNPSLRDEREMKQKLFFRYDDLFADAMKPPLQSRRDLLSWACQAKNESLRANEASGELLEDCENYGGLLRKYGPDYEQLKKKLAHVRGLFD